MTLEIYFSGTATLQINDCDINLFKKLNKAINRKFFCRNLIINDKDGNQTIININQVNFARLIKSKDENIPQT